MDRQLGRAKGSATVDGTDNLLGKWGPGLLSWPLPLAAYCGLALVAPGVLGTPAGFIAGIAVAALAGVLVAALISKALGLYRRDANGNTRIDPQRQGIFAAETALLVAYFALPRFDIEQPLWLYALAFFVAGGAGMAATGVVAGRRARLSMPRGTSLPARPAEMRRPAPPARVAPLWAQRISAACIALGAVALVRLLFGGESYFLWAGLGLLVGGALLPSLVVLLGGGRAPDA